MFTSSRTAGFALALLLLLAATSASPSPAARTPAPLEGPELAVVDRRRLVGPQPFLILLCKLAGSTAEPEAPAYFHNLLEAHGDGLDAYWREVSYANISLEGSAVVGWRDLPGTEAAYKDANGRVDLQRLASDCIEQAADQDVHRFAGLSLVYNADLDPNPQAGTACADAGDGHECFHVIWMWPAWLHNEAAWAHEMGHVFGLAHSSDPSGHDYANAWDVMSTISGCTCGRDHNAMPQHPIAYQLDRLGWIPAAAKYVARREGAAVVHLERTSQPAAGGYLMAEVPTRSSDIYYTVEARSRTGFDIHAPGTAIVIHEVDLSRATQRAHLVFTPADGHLTAARGMWLPGSQFEDETNQVSIAVEAATPTGFTVSIRTGFAAAAGQAPRVARAGAGDSPFAEIGSSDFRAETSLLAIAAGARQEVYVVSARTATLGILPAIQMNRVHGSEWGPAEQAPGGWSHLPGEAPAIAVDRLGAVSMAWAGSDHTSAMMSAVLSATSHVWLMQRTAAGAWRAPLRVDDYPGQSAQHGPALGVDGSGRLEVAWEDARNGNGDIYFAEVIGDVPAANRRLNDDAGRAPQSEPAIAADADGNVEVLWVDLRSGTSEIYEARRSAGGAWSANVRLAAAGAEAHGAPAVVADREGNFYAAWIAYPACNRAKGETGSLMTAVRPKGSAWGAPVVVQEHVVGGKASRPVLAAGAGGRVYLAWEEWDGAGVTVYLATGSALSGWSAPQRMAWTPADGLAKPALAIDDAGDIYLGWKTTGGTAAHLVEFRTSPLS